MINFEAENRENLNMFLNSIDITYIIHVSISKGKSFAIYPECCWCMCGWVCVCVCVFTSVQRQQFSNCLDVHSITVLDNLSKQVSFTWMVKKSYWWLQTLREVGHCVDNHIAKIRAHIESPFISWPWRYIIFHSNQGIHYHTNFGPYTLSGRPTDLPRVIGSCLALPQFVGFF